MGEYLNQFLFYMMTMMILMMPSLANGSERFIEQGRSDEHKHFNGRSLPLSLLSIQNRLVLIFFKLKKILTTLI